MQKKKESKTPTSKSIDYKSITAFNQLLIIDTLLELRQKIDYNTEQLEGLKNWVLRNSRSNGRKSPEQVDYENKLLFSGLGYRS